MINLKKGEVFAFKTDTVWGFGCHVDDDLAIDNIYKIKKREKTKPLILMSHDFKYLKKYIKNPPKYALELIEKYLPGGLTLIFEKSQFLNPKVNQGGDFVGIRIPNSKDFFELSKKIKGHILATTSCNIAHEEPVKNYKTAKEKFGDVATIIKPLVDSENPNVPSTVIICYKDNYEILRQGAIKL